MSSQENCEQIDIVQSIQNKLGDDWQFIECECFESREFTFQYTKEGVPSFNKKDVEAEFSTNKHICYNMYMCFNLCKIGRSWFIKTLLIPPPQKLVKPNANAFLYGKKNKKV